MRPSPSPRFAGRGKEGARELYYAQLALFPENWHEPFMCYHMTASGSLVPVWSKTAYDEVMLHCARIGFKP